MQQNSLSVLLSLAVFSLILLLLILKRRKAQRYELEKDKSGLWKYHKETQFRRQAAVGSQLAAEGSKQKPEGRGEKKVKLKDRTCTAVISFQGDMRAKGQEGFAKLIDEVLINKEQISEVVVCVASPGGGVPHYGHLYAEMKRMRDAGLMLTVCIDVVAASGGYLMSLPAQTIIAAPFSFVGSIGVVAFVPNIRKLLLKNDIVPRTFYAGNLKRTVTLTDEAGPEEVAHFQEQLESIHSMFKQALKRYRPAVDLERVANGDVWTAEESVEKQLGLVDRLGTSREYLLEKNQKEDLVYLSSKRSLLEDGFNFLVESVAHHLERIIAAPNSWGRSGW